MALRVVPFLIGFVLIALSPSKLSAQMNDPIFDAWMRGQYEDVVNAVVNNPGADLHYVYVAADSLRRLNRRPEARQQFERISAAGYQPWIYVGWSGQWFLADEYPASYRDSQALLAAQWAADAAPGWVLPAYHLAFMFLANQQYPPAADWFDWVIYQIPSLSWASFYSGVAHQNWSNADSRHPGGIFIHRYDMFVQILNPYTPRPAEHFATTLLLRTVAGPSCWRIWPPPVTPC